MKGEGRRARCVCHSELMCEVCAVREGHEKVVFMELTSVPFNGSLLQIRVSDLSAVSFMTC